MKHGMGCMHGSSWANLYNACREVSSVTSITTSLPGTPLGAGLCRQSEGPSNDPPEVVLKEPPTKNPDLFLLLTPFLIYEYVYNMLHIFNYKHILHPVSCPLTDAVNQDAAGHHPRATQRSCHSCAPVLQRCPPSSLQRVRSNHLCRPLVTMDVGK